VSSAHGAGVDADTDPAPLRPSWRASGGLTARALPVASRHSAFTPAAMLATITAVSLIVYEWVGLTLPAPGWVNIDLI
jgi:hypothetical protein